MIGAGDFAFGWMESGGGERLCGGVIRCILSFGDGVGGYAEDKLQVWSYDGTKWAKFVCG